MTYNVFGGTLNLALSVDYLLKIALVWGITARDGRDGKSTTMNSGIGFGLVRHLCQLCKLYDVWLLVVSTDCNQLSLFWCI